MRFVGLSPPQRHSLLFLDHHPLTVLLHPISDGSGVVRVFQDKLLLFETSDDFGATIKNLVGAKCRYRREC